MRDERSEAQKRTALDCCTLAVILFVKVGSDHRRRVADPLDKGQKEESPTRTGWTICISLDGIAESLPN